MRKYKKYHELDIKYARLYHHAKAEISKNIRVGIKKSRHRHGRKAEYNLLSPKYNKIAFELGMAKLDGSYNHKTFKQIANNYHIPLSTAYRLAKRYMRHVESHYQDDKKAR